MSLPSSPRYGFKPIWVTLHTAEGARTIDSLFNFFDDNQNASSHAGADGYQLSGDWVPDERAAWTLLNGNPRSLNLEMCGFARWTRAQWLSEGWVDGVWNPRQMIRNAATWARRKCDKHGIPRRLLTPAEVGQGHSGIIDHARYTYGTGDGDHTDVGANFPWDVFFSDLNATASGGGINPLEVDDMPMLIQVRGRKEVYVIDSTVRGASRRWIENEVELNVLKAAGAKITDVNEWDLAAFPERRDVDARELWNYLLPTTPGKSPAKFTEAHQLAATIYQNTTPAPKAV